MLMIAIDRKVQYLGCLALVLLSLAVNGELTVVNSQGTVTINPLISELRMATAGLAGVLAKLGVGELPRVSAGEKSIRDQLAERRALRGAG